MKYLRFYQRWYEVSFNRYIHATNGDRSIWNLMRAPWFALCFLILLSVTLSLIEDTWLFTGMRWLDPWIYVGYGYTFDDPAFGENFKNGYYKIGRIPWVYLQYLIRQFFSPLSSTYILQYSCLWLGTFAVYCTIRRLLGYIPALIAAVFLCIYRPFLGSGGADYHNTLVGPLYALSFLFLTIAAQKEKHALRWLVLFGCVYGLTVHTMILYINFAPVLLFHFYVVRKMFCDKVVLFRNFLFATLSGFVLATLLCGLISVAYGYQFLFFLPQVGLTKTFLYGHWATSPWWPSWSSGWILNAYWLGPLAAGMIFSLGSLIFWRHRTKEHPTIPLSQSLNLQFLLLGLVWTFWQLLKKDTLSTAYFAYPLIIPFAMSIAAHFSLCLSNQVRNHYLPIILGLGAIAVAILHFKFQFPIQALFRFSPFFVMLLFFCAIFSFLLFYKRTVILAAGLLAFASATSWYYELKPYPVRDAYLALIDATQWIYNTYNRTTKKVLIWFDENAPKDSSPSLSDIGYSLTNTAFDYLHYPFPMPSIQNLKAEELKARLSGQKSKVVVLVTESERDVKELQNRLEQLDIHLQLDQYHEICRNKIRIPLYILKG